MIEFVLKNTPFYLSSPIFITI